MRIIEKGEQFTKIELEIANELIENGNYIVSEVNSKLLQIYGNGHFLDLSDVISETLQNSDLNHYPEYEIERLFKELNEFEKKYSIN